MSYRSCLWQQDIRARDQAGISVSRHCDGKNSTVFYIKTIKRRIGIYFFHFTITNCISLGSIPVFQVLIIKEVLKARARLHEQVHTRLGRMGLHLTVPIEPVINDFCAAEFTKQDVARDFHVFWDHQNGSLLPCTRLIFRDHFT